MQENSVEKVADAIRHHRALPPLSCKDLTEGYRLQASVTEAINGDKQIGLKAGVTSASMQKQFELEAPLLGSTYHQGELKSGCSFSVQPEQQIECEIGAIVNSDGSPIALVAIVELVFLQFSRPSDYNIPNAVAANLGADRYICGSPVPWDKNLEKVAITVKKDNAVLTNQTNDYSFGTPEAGVTWMVNEAKKRSIWRDNNQQKILLLGTCGEAISCAPGNYEIDFETLGKIKFTVNHR